ncbi:MAG TPA: GHMP kinase, partial [Spirochaetia bacterium]|nr:GHMP kinase [Spirochaetia bacterium]
MNTAESHEIDLFVPGRICLFGEHSDWAASYRRLNSRIEKGYTIICGTNQGLSARARRREGSILFRRTDAAGKTEETELPLDPRELVKIAEAGGFWSYIAGVAYQVMTHYHVGGIEIDNYKTDLPLKKGLSSSAAVCVLVTRAFNRLYDLKMTVRGEMDMAYRGEITTPSRCGRMDQGCAYGSRPVLMTFDGDAIDVHELRVPRDLHYVIVDLHAHKDTIKILADLNHAFPFAENAKEEAVQRYLGGTNRELVSKAVDALEGADSIALGGLMTRAQHAFDEALIPSCPDQLTAPALHALLSSATLKPLLLGGKGVGSQGDGTAQLLAKDAASQAEVLRIVEQE